jgi:LAS superfamily LD-carboxypeptidase LdcB
MAKYEAEKFDSTLNTFREIYSDPAVDKYQGTVILPLDFSLEMDGISGIIPNSAFEIPSNSLPSSYLVRTGDNKGKSKIAFILHSIDHNFGNNKWTTKITGQTLNIRFDELTEAQKKSIEDFKLPKLKAKAKVSFPNTPVSTNQGGSTRNIKGAAYKNGEIPDTKLRTILNESTYNLPAVNQSDGGRVRLFTDASLALDKLLAAATKANVKLRINSAYRTYKDQVRVWKGNCTNAIGTGKCIPKKGQGPAAIPGTSNHGFGLAVDLANNSGKKLSTSMSEYDWVAENGPGFGFKRIASEAWHWEYQTT